MDVNMYAIKKLREEIDRSDVLPKEKKKRLTELVDAAEMQMYDDLVSVETAAQMLDVSERHVHNLAADPRVDLWKYNTNGTLKNDNRPTKICFRCSEIFKYNEEKK